MSTTKEDTSSLLTLPEAVKKAQAAFGRGAFLSDVASDAAKLTADPECTAQRLTAVVERDPGLGLRLLSAANSVLYSPTRPIESLDRAIMRLGFSETRNIIFAAAVTRLMQRLSLKEEWMREVLCQHAITTGLLGRRLSQAFGLGFKGEDFTAGLLHDVGRIALAVVAPVRFAEVDPLTFDENDDVTALERVHLGTDHCELGAALANALQLPDSLCEVVRYHHDIGSATLDPRLVALVAAADEAANYLHRGENALEYDPGPNRGLTVLWEERAADDIERECQLVDIRSAMSSVLTDASQLARVLT